MSVFLSAITDDKGGVDAGYLALFWALVGWSISSGVLLLAGAFVVFFKSGEPGAAIQNTGVALAAISGGFATVVGAGGLFRAGDKPRAPSGGGTTVNVTPPAA